MPGENAQALEITIGALVGLSDEHTAIIAHARTIAREIDSGETDAKLHGEYRQILKVLLAIGRTDEVDAFGKMLRELGEDLHT